MAKEKNILIVDDELGPREALRMILKDHYNLDFATNGQEAVDLIKTKDIDLIIMDVKMPVLNGMEALELIKSYDPFIAVLMVTGYGTIDNAVEAMKVGALDYISKPFDSFEILEKVEKAFDEVKERLEGQKMIEQIQEASEKLSRQQVNLQEQLVQLSKLSSVGMLAQGLAHNISSPLLIILGRAELMKDKLVKLRSKISELADDSYDMENDLPIVKEYDQNIKDAEIIIENVNKLTDIIKNMMNKSRQDQALEKQLLNLSELLEVELKFLESDIYFKHNIEKEIVLEPNLPLVHGVYSDFSQAFLNIIQNAIEVMYDSDVKKLTVKTSYDERFIYVIIHDTGCGIPQENIEKIFQPYFSTKKPDKGQRKSTGTGLGLPMVEILLKPYSVEIEVESKPGDTTFILRIPYGNNH